MPRQAGARLSCQTLGVFICRTDQVVVLQARLSLRFLGNSMTKKLISSGSTFEEQIGYSRAVVVGDWVFVSGTTGFDYKTMSISESPVQQTEQCLKNIESALQQADSSLKDVVRVTYVLPDGADFENAGRCYEGISEKCARLP